MIELKNIAVSYNKSAGNVFENVNKTFDNNEFVIIKGPSGAGKSTLLAVIGAYLNPSFGNVIYNGKDINKLNKKEIDLIHREKFGYVPQSNVMLKSYSILENVTSPYLYGNKNLEEIKLEERAGQILSDLGLSNKLYNKPNELSGGELKRVAIARAILMEPEIVLADEPTTGLDSRTGKIILDYLYDYSRKNKLVIVSTHDEKAFKYEARIEDITSL